MRRALRWAAQAAWDRLTRCEDTRADYPEFVPPDGWQPVDAESKLMDLRGRLYEALGDGTPWHDDDIVLKVRQLRWEVTERGKVIVRLRERHEQLNATIEEQANDLTQLRGKLEATQRQNARLVKHPPIEDGLCGRPFDSDAEAEDRSEPPPGVIIANGPGSAALIEPGYLCDSAAEAVAAAWEHYDAIAKRAREQAGKLYRAEIDETRKLLAKTEASVANWKDEYDLVTQRWNEALAKNAHPSQHRFEKGDASHGWANQCSRTVFTDGAQRHCGYPLEAHTMHVEVDRLTERAEKAERERDEAQQRLRHLCVVAKDISGRSDPDGAPVLGVVRKALKQLKHERDEARTTAASAAAQLVMRVGGLANRHKDAIATTRRVFADFKRVDEALDYLEQHEAAAARKADAEREEQAK